MNLRKIHEQEIAKRQGNTWRTLVMLVWLSITAVAGYFAVNWIFSQRILTYSMFYDSLNLPPDTPRWIIQGVLIFGIVLTMQSFLFIGFALGNPTGRRKAGRPSMHSINRDALGNEYEGH